MTISDAPFGPITSSSGNREGLPPIREACWAGALLAVLLLLFFFTPIVRNELLSPADLLLKSTPWRQAATPDFEPANSLLSDYVYQFRPWRSFAVTSLKAGHIPLWNPYNYAGSPFLGNGQSAVLYPINLPFLILSDATATILSAMIRLFIAGLSAYLFGRVIGLTIIGAAITGLGFTFSGFLVVWLLWPQVNVAIWLPSLFLTVEGIVRRPAIPRSLALAVIVWIQFLGGHPETSLHILSAVTLYAGWRVSMIYRHERDWRQLRYRLVSFTGALVLGIGGAAIQLLPLAEYILTSATLHERLATAPSIWSLPRPRLLAALALVCPYCFGSHLRGDLPLGVLLGAGNFNELNGAYVGLVSLLLAAITVACGTRRGLDLFFLILGGLAFCVAYSVPPIFNVIQALPLFRIAANTRSLLLLAFALSVLAGRGSDLIMAVPETMAKRILKYVQRILIAGTIGIVIVTGSLLLSLLFFREEILAEGKARIMAKVGKETFQQQPEHYLTLLPLYYDRLVRLLVREGARQAILLAITGVAISLAIKVSRGRRGFAWVLPAVLVIDLFSFGRNYNPAIPRQLEYPPHDAIEFLRKQPGLFRVLALDGAFPPNTNILFGLHEVRGYNALETESYKRFLAATGDYPQPVAHFKTLYFSNFRSKLVDLLNVKYLISDRELRDPKLTPVWADSSGVRIYENLSVMPRAFMIYHAQVFRDEGDVDTALRDPRFNPSVVALLDKAHPGLLGPVDPAPLVQVTDYTPEQVVVDVSSRFSGLLILADAWFPGWEATVDGLHTKILRANLLLRAVPTPAGHHQVIFRYNPLTFRLGLITSESAFVIAVTLALTGLFLRKRHDQKTSLKIISPIEPLPPRSTF